MPKSKTLKLPGKPNAEKAKAKALKAVSAKKAKATAKKAAKAVSKAIEKRTKAESPSKVRNGAGTKKAASKRSTGRKASKRVSKSNPHGFGVPIGDFSNADTIKVLDRKGLGERAKLFRSGKTVADTLRAQKEAGLHGKRRAIRLAWQRGYIALVMANGKTR